MTSSPEAVATVALLGGVLGPIGMLVGILLVTGGGGYTDG